ncbi:hypothetical protein GE300_17890 [Rhodobacteraceae bacterium 2CG4]|uniref:Glycosyltransferase RgtA/B/C/D-like domain-containing protein n=1 Tax=Halovulum marinum TaxID=2662447 RepID=A0A6L5Z4H2_9RHOB|nr:hypothetical protein [Halovulum marinum]MSU91453.1 hypothetical protein [Halovulum marinum]
MIGAEPASARPATDRLALAAPAAFGVLLYAALMTNGFSAGPERDFGTFVYNHYFLSVLDGRLDLPARIIGMEGLYAADGRAYTVHGLAPLLARALAWPFVDLRQTSVAAASILGFTALGSALYHLTFARIVLRFGPAEAQARRTALLLVGLAAWLSTPAVILASNNSFYHEQYALAFFFGAAWLAGAAQVVVFGAPAARVVLVLALFAGLMVHARPHVALGLYAGTLAFLARDLLDRRGRAVPAAAASLLVLFGFGALYLAVNHLRSGSMTGLGSLAWGFLHFGEYTAETPRVALQDGKTGWQPGRIPGNLLLYLVDLPRGLGGEALGWLHRWMTRPFGFVAIETPRLGLLFSAAPWAFVIFAGLRARPLGLRMGWVPLLACSVGPVFLLSFSMVALRYRVEMWPPIAALALLALPRLMCSLTDAAALHRFRRTAVLTLALSAGSLTLALPYSIPGWDAFGDWSRAECAERFAGKGFAAPDIARICADP